MGIPIPGKDSLHIEAGPWLLETLYRYKTSKRVNSGVVGTPVEFQSDRIILSTNIGVLNLREIVLGQEQTQCRPHI